MMRAFFMQLEYNPYSYNTIYYMGFAFFTLSVLVTNIVLEYRMLRFPELYHAEAILRTLLDSAKQYMLLSSPFLLLVSAALVVSNLSLIRHEGKRLVNLLAVIGAVAGVIGIPAAYEKIKSRFMLIAPAAVCLVCASAADGIKLDPPIAATAIRSPSARYGSGR